MSKMRTSLSRRDWSLGKATVDCRNCLCVYENVASKHGHKSCAFYGHVICIHSAENYVFVNVCVAYHYH